jgi:ribose transport system substrate-binding protein
MLFACSQKQDEAEKGGDKQKTIAFVMKTLTNPFFIMMEKGVRKAEKELGCKVIVQAAEEETSVEQLVGIVEAMIARKVDAICVTPSGSTELVPVFVKAQKAGIPIIDVDVEIDSAAAAAAGLTKYHYVGADNFEGGYMAGKHLAEALGGKGRVAILEGIPGVDNAEKRKGGAMKAFGEYEGIQLAASQTAHWKTEEALNIMTNILQAHPDLNGVFCANDMMAFGAINAIESGGNAGKVLVASYDALAEAKNLIRKGKMLCSIDQRPDLMGYNGVKFAMELLEGKEPPVKFMVPLTNITKDNVQ